MNDEQKALALLSRMARTALNWSQERAASEAGVSKVWLARLESLTGGAIIGLVAKLFIAYEAAGVSLNVSDDVLRVEINQAAAKLSSENIKLNRRSDYKGERQVIKPDTLAEVLENMKVVIKRLDLFAQAISKKEKSK